jgi:hypothetical protein
MDDMLSLGEEDGPQHSNATAGVRLSPESIRNHPSSSPGHQSPNPSQLYTKQSILHTSLSDIVYSRIFLTSLQFHSFFALFASVPLNPVAVCFSLTQFRPTPTTALPSAIMSASDGLKGRKVFKVFNQEFVVDQQYNVTKELGQGAYGIVW